MGNTMKGFHDLVDTGVRHFGSLLKVLEHENMGDILKVISAFPRCYFRKMEYEIVLLLTLSNKPKCI